MAAGDLYQVHSHIAVNNVGTSFGLYFRELTSDATWEGDCTDLATMFGNKWQVPLQSSIGTTAQVSKFVARRVKGAAAISGVKYADDLVGTLGGECLPANNGARIKLLQDDGPGKHNGGFTLPGIPNDLCDGNSVDNVYAAVIDAGIIPLISQILQEQAVSGRAFRPVVVQKGIPVSDTSLWVDRQISGASLITQVRSQSRRRSTARNFA